MRDTRRYLGLELAGAKNHKTSLAVLEHYPKENKVFLLEIHDKIAAPKDCTPERPNDEVLLELIHEQERIQGLGVNVPLQLPPCIGCARKTCLTQGKCSVAPVRWMKQATQKAQRSRNKQVRAIEFTPYTQRPVELWIRYEVLPELPEWARFDIDETLGGNKAPLTARMHFLKRHLRGIKLIEAWPKLSVALLATQMGLQKRTISTYRHLEQGSHSREEFLEALSERHSVFIYEKDLRKLAHSLPAFDAFVCAYTALLADSGRCARMPTSFPCASGWVDYPR